MFQAYHDELVAISMLVGDHPPLFCSCCMGTGTEARLWGKRTCGQCMGGGYDMIGEKTKLAVLARQGELGV